MSLSDSVMAFWEVLENDGCSQAEIKDGIREYLDNNIEKEMLNKIVAELALVKKGCHLPNTNRKITPREAKKAYEFFGNQEDAADFLEVSLSTLKRRLSESKKNS